MPEPIIGIDLGTTNSVVATTDDDGDPRLLRDPDGEAIIPSIVSFHPTGDVLVGRDAKKRRIIDPRNTIHSVKRIIGRRYYAREVLAASTRVSYRVKEGSKDRPVIETRQGDFSPSEISAIVLDHMRKIAVRQIGSDVGRAVITVPANFTDAQRAATASAGAIAGMDVPLVINEPTAAAIAYGHRRDLDEIVAVYDFGGGTFDITVLKLEGEIFEVLGTAGDSFLGGDDIDERIVDRMTDDFLRSQHVDLRDNPVAMQRLRGVAEQVKIQLSDKSRALVRIDELAYGDGGIPLDLEMKISRDELIQRCADVIERTFPICDEVAAMAQLRRGDITDVVLVGGSTRMPYVRERVAQYFGKEPRTDVNPDESVALGAAIQASALVRASEITGVVLPTQPTLEEVTHVAQVGPDAATRLEHGQSLRDTEVTTPGTGFTAEEMAVIGDGDVTIEPGPGAPDSGDVTMVDEEDDDATIERDRDVDLARTDEFHGVRADTSDQIESSPKQNLRSALPMGRRRGASGWPLAPVASAVTRADPGAMTLMVGDDEEHSVTVERPDLGVQPLNLDSIPHIATPGGPDAGPDPGVSQPLTASVPGLPVILDVTPYSLGLGTVGGFAEFLIARNSRIPIQQRQVFATSHDRQTIVRIQVCQGESRRLTENTLLGVLVLENLQPRPRGQTRIEVTFQINSSGLLNVQALDQATGAEQRATIHLRGGESPAEVEQSRNKLQALIH